MDKLVLKDLRSAFSEEAIQTVLIAERLERHGSGLLAERGAAFYVGGEEEGR